MFKEMKQISQETDDRTKNEKIAETIAPIIVENDATVSDLGQIFFFLKTILKLSL